MKVTRKIPYKEIRYYRGVLKKRNIDLKHLIISIVLSSVVAFSMKYISGSWQACFLGYFFGIFLIINMQHLQNITGYIASRKGLHGKLIMHQRTAYKIQSGRYFAVTVFLFILYAFSESLFILGVAIAGLVSGLRLILYTLRVPKLDNTKEAEFK
jgi:hypothetical protein